MFIFGFVKNLVSDRWYFVYNIKIKDLYIKYNKFIVISRLISLYVYIIM